MKRVSLVTAAAALLLAPMTLPPGGATPSAVAGEQVETAEVGAGEVWLPAGDFSASALVRVPREGEAPPPLAADRTLRLHVPVAGRASAQLAVTAVEDLTEVRAAVTELSGESGSIAADAVEVRYPAYIPDLVRGGVVADPLREVPAVDVPAAQHQPVWFTVEVPAGTAPGRYTGTVTLAAANGELGEWPLEIDVVSPELRQVADRPFVLDLWAQPDAVAYEHGLELWSEEHWAALRPYLEDLAEHGQDVVNAAVVQDPWMVNHQGEWRAQTQHPYNTTVEWLWDGEEFSFDFAVFDRYVTESADAGIDGAIHAFAMLQFSGPELLTYTDTRTGERVVEEVELGGDRYREAWGAFLRDFTEHLTERGWFERTRLAFDERPIATMNVAFDVIEQAAPEWLDKVALAANSLAEADIADYISFNYSFLDQVPDSLIADRLDRDEPTLFYTFYDPVRPNTVTASPPVSSRVLGWVVEQRDLDGYLRWTYNSWPVDVYENPAFRYGQGDEYLVYPGADADAGPVSSIRWEMFRDGQEDAEILNLAKERLGADSPVVTAALDAVDPRAEDEPATWATMLQQRARVLDAMGTRDGVSIGTSLEHGAVVAGTRAGLTVQVRAGEEALSGLTVELDGTAEASPAGPVDVGPGEQASWELALDVPEDARNLTVISGRVLDTDGELVGRFTEVPLVDAAISADGPMTAERAGSPDAEAPVVIEVPVRNLSTAARTLTWRLTGLDFWQAEDTEVELTAGATTNVALALYPRGQIGWSTVSAELVGEDGTVVAEGSFDIVSGGVHVSDLEWLSETNGWGPVERDMSVGEAQAGDGRTMSIGGREYSKGVGVHAVSRISLDVPGTCSRFVSDYGIDDEVGGAASVTFEVLGDGERLWASELVRPASGAQRADVDITGVQVLELVVGDGGNGIAQDHANWAGAWIACEPPQPQTPIELLESLQGTLESYVVSGEIAGPIAHQLTHALDQARGHLEADRTQPAVTAVERAIRHLENPKRPDTLDEQAGEELLVTARELADRIVAATP